MPILLDTGFFVAIGNKNDKHHERADILLEELLKGKWGTRITTDYILDETITVTWVRTKNKNLVKTVYEYFIGPESICLLHSFPYSLLEEAWQLFQKYSTINRPLRFTDCSLLAYAHEKNIEQLISFDKEFDGMINRIC